MTLLSAEKISKKFDDQIILEQASYTIVTGDKIGLVGKNGCGKTTLFNIISGVSEVDSGSVSKSKQCRIDYAEQEKTERPSNEEIIEEAAQNHKGAKVISLEDLKKR